MVTSLDVYAAGNVELNGTATVEAGEPVTIMPGTIVQTARNSRLRTGLLESTS